MAVFSEMDLENKMSEAGTPETQKPAQPPAEEQAPAALAQHEQSSTQAPQLEPAAADDNAKAPDDVEKRRKAHEEAEATRKAEWDAAQAAKKAALQEQIRRVNSMSDDEAMIASTKRVSADTEKITRRNMKECVAEVIQTKCLEDPSCARKTLNPQKSMVRCFQYISRKAWDYVQDELKANGIQPGTGTRGYGCDIPDGLCYQWAEEYFNDPNAQEDQQPDERFIPKPFYDNTRAAAKAKKKSKEPPAPKNEKKGKEPQPMEEQLTLNFEPLGKVG